VCFDKRFLISAQKALELGESKITTTLLVSPLKSQEQLKRIGDDFYAKHGVKFVSVDYRSGGGTQDQSRVTKEQQLYRQDYCGCIYGLSIQRASQEKLLDELFSPISGAMLPASIEERIALYTKRNELEVQNIDYKITKHKFLNYRIFSCNLTEGKNIEIAAHPLSYSTLPRKKAQGRIEFTQKHLAHLNRDEVKFLTLQSYNELTKSNYATILELIYNPLSFEQELQLRQLLLESHYDLTPIIVVEKLSDKKLTLQLDATVYEDTKEKLIIL